MSFVPHYLPGIDKLVSVTYIYIQMQCIHLDYDISIFAYPEYMCVCLSFGVTLYREGGECVIWLY